MTRLKDPTLAAAITDEELAWRRVIAPVTAALGDEIARRDFSGRTLVSFQHILPDTIPTLLPFVAAGARVRVGACNPDSTDDAAAAYLAAHGVEVHGWSGMTPRDHADTLDILSAEPADVVGDMGGELIAAMVRAGQRPKGALEATTTGVHRVAALDLDFPVFNWNDIALKDRLHNRHHVAQEVWPVFSAVTGLTLYGRRVLVIGFGPVGRGVAERARDLGAVVSVVETDPVRALEARHHGCAVVPMTAGLAENAIIVTATGRSDILGPAQLHQLRNGAIVFNVGHSNREIDIDWLATHPTTRMRPHVERVDLGSRHLYVLNRGSLLNLAPGAGGHGKDLFDPFSAILLAGFRWLLDGGATEIAPGFHAFPHALETDIASRVLDGR